MNKDSKLKDALVSDYRMEAQKMEYDDIPFLTDEEVLAMNPLTEFDENLNIAQGNIEEYYYLKKELLNLRKELKDVVQEIKEDTETLLSDESKWKQSEKTEWMHDISSNRLKATELKMKIKEIEQRMQSLAKVKQNERGKK